MERFLEKVIAHVFPIPEPMEGIFFQWILSLSLLQRSIYMTKFSPYFLCKCLFYLFMQSHRLFNGALDSRFVCSTEGVLGELSPIKRIWNKF